MKRAAIFLAALGMAATLWGCSGGDIVELEEALLMTGEALTQELAGVSREQITKAWGQPSSMLSGMYGDIFRLEDGQKLIILYYDEDNRIEAVKITDRTT